jgi:hypothetical protein
MNNKKGKKASAPAPTLAPSQDADPGLPPHIPGEDFDPEDSIGATISSGWTFIKFSLPGCSAVVALILYLANSKIDPVGIASYSRTTLTWLFVAMGLSLLNALSWSTGPQLDLKDLRRWIRTENALFPVNNIEERTIWFQIGLVSLSTLVPLLGPIIFGLNGFLIYLINFLGFMRIKRKVHRGVRESLDIYARDEDLPADVKEKLLSALRVIDEYWGTPRAKHLPFIRREAQQIRHAFLLICFGSVIALGALGRWGGGSTDYYKTLAYAVGVATLAIAIISITVLRALRQDKLHAILSSLPREYRPLLSSKKTLRLQSEVLSIFLCL